MGVVIEKWAEYLLKINILAYPIDEGLFIILLTYSYQYIIIEIILEDSHLPPKRGSLTQIPLNYCYWCMMFQEH